TGSPLLSSKRCPQYPPLLSRFICSSLASLLVDLFQLHVYPSYSNATVSIPLNVSLSPVNAFSSTVRPKAELNADATAFGLKKVDFGLFLGSTKINMRPSFVFFTYQKRRPSLSHFMWEGT